MSEELDRIARAGTALTTLGVEPLLIDVWEFGWSTSRSSARRIHPRAGARSPVYKSSAATCPAASAPGSSSPALTVDACTRSQASMATSGWPVMYAESASVGSASPSSLRLSSASERSRYALSQAFRSMASRARSRTEVESVMEKSVSDPWRRVEGPRPTEMQVPASIRW